MYQNKPIRIFAFTFPHLYKLLHAHNLCYIKGHDNIETKALLDRSEKHTSR